MKDTRKKKEILETAKGKKTKVYREAVRDEEGKRNKELSKQNEVSPEKAQYNRLKASREKNMPISSRWKEGKALVRPEYAGRRRLRRRFRLVGKNNRSTIGPPEKRKKEPLVQNQKRDRERRGDACDGEGAKVVPGVPSACLRQVKERENC